MLYNQAFTTLNMINDSRYGMSFPTRVNLKLSWKKPSNCSQILSVKSTVLNYALLNTSLRGLSRENIPRIM